MHYMSWVYPCYALVVMEMGRWGGSKIARTLSKRANGESAECRHSSTLRKDLIWQPFFLGYVCHLGEDDVA